MAHPSFFEGWDSRPQVARDITQAHFRRRRNPTLAQNLRIVHPQWEVVHAEIANGGLPAEYMTKRRIAITVLGAILPFLLVALGSYFVETHTTDGRLAMYVMLYSQQMSDQQLAQAIGQDPFAVIRRTALMTRAVKLVAALVVGILIACFERRMPGKLTALVLTPYFIWDFSMRAFSVARTPAQTAITIGKVLGVNVAWVVLSVLVALAVARLIAHSRPQPLQEASA